MRIGRRAVLNQGVITSGSIVPATAEEVKSPKLPLVSQALAWHIRTVLSLHIRKPKVARDQIKTPNSTAEDTKPSYVLHLVVGKGP